MTVIDVPRETSEAKPASVGLGQRILEVPVDQIDVGANVRADAGDLAELAASIAELGVLQPIRIREAGDRFEVVYGQRRLLAARQAGLARIPAILDTSVPVDGQRTVEQLVENLQRADLNALDEARALKALADNGLTHEAIAQRLGRSRPWVSNAIGILDLDPKVLPLVESGQLTAAHAKALGSLKGKPQRDYAETAVRNGASAHELERMVQDFHARQKRDAEEVEKLATWAEQTEQLLIADGADKATSTMTTLDGYGYSAEPQLQALKARGWKVKTESWSRAPKVCDCSAWGVGRTWDGKTTIRRRCVVHAHYAEKVKSEGRRESVSWRERNKEYARQEAMKKNLQALIAPTFIAAFQKLPPNVARILLWSVMDYSLNDWVKEHKGDRKKPDAWGALSDQSSEELGKEITRFVFRDFGDRYNVKLDLPAIAEAFGVSLEPLAKARTKKVRVEDLERVPAS